MDGQPNISTLEICHFPMVNQTCQNHFPRHHFSRNLLSRNHIPAREKFFPEPNESQENYLLSFVPIPHLQRDAYDNLLHAFIKILREEGPAELYRGLTPSLIGVVPYAATNYFAYETLKKLYRKTFKEEEIGNIATLLIGSAAGAISSSATFPLEVARKHMQVGAVGSRRVYKNMLHALVSILEEEGIGGLYKGLGPSCMKLVPAAGISFMCYEACKKILIDAEEDA